MARIAAWMLDLAYLATIALASPLILWSALRHGKHREGFAEKLLGRVPRRDGNEPCVWLHAVSVGEVNLLATTIAELSRHRPNWRIVVSTTSKTGYDLARKKYADRTVFYAPLDFSWAVRGAVRRIRPTLLVLAELELWPNLIAAARESGARVAIINGRISDKSFRGYRRLRPLVARVLQRIDLVAAQDDETAERFLNLGASPQTVVVTGSLKFDGAPTNRRNPRTIELARLAGLGADEVVFLAGSTQAPEEQYALDMLARLVAEHSRLRLILVPRHRERFEEVAELVARSGFPWQRRSKLGDCDPPSEPGAIHAETTDGPPWRVLLIDAIGELGAWWGAATVGFVGGSFGDRGGQNMLEPAAYGVATCFGPNTWNFRDIVRRLIAVDGAVVVRDAVEFEAFVRRVLDDGQYARDLGERAQRLVLSQQGATQRTADQLQRLVEGPAATATPAADYVAA
jgi:3-deoxy-D-manno-octulosonic-acid transferase